MSDLIERLREATAQSRELDAEIAKRFGWTYEVDDEELWDCWRDPEGKARYLPKLTSSVDAAIALAERVLPGWRIITEHGDNYSIVQFKRGWGVRAEILGVATVERADDLIALAMCEAIIRAVTALTPAKQEEGQNP